MMNQTHWLRPSKTPTVARLFAILVMLFPAFASGQTWDEDAFVKHGLSLVGQQQTEAAEQRLIQAETAQATAHSLPQLELEYEPMWSNNTRRDEFTVGLKQSFDLSGWRAQLRTAAKIRQEAVSMNKNAAQNEVSNTIRLAFWKVRLHEDRLQIYANIQARFAEALRNIEARANAGDASGLDVLRIQRQLQLMRAEALAESLQLEEAWSQLDAWREDGNRPTISGPIMPPKTSFSPRENPALKRLKLEQNALSEEAKAWGSPGFRNWEVGAGYRLENDQIWGHGALISLTLPLAFWNIDDSKNRAIEAQKDVLEVQKNILQKQITRAFESTELRLNKALKALESLPAQNQDAELSQLVARAYGADEASLFDLIEAMRGDVELGLARTELEWEARRAFIELQFLTSWEQAQ